MISGKRFILELSKRYVLRPKLYVDVACSFGCFLDIGPLSKVVNRAHEGRCSSFRELVPSPACSHPDYSESEAPAERVIPTSSNAEVPYTKA